MGYLYFEKKVMIRKFDKKAMINFKMYIVTNWRDNNNYTHIAQYPKEQRQTDNEVWLINKTIFLKNHRQNLVETPYSDPFIKINIRAYIKHIALIICPSSG